MTNKELIEILKKYPEMEVLFEIKRNGKLTFDIPEDDNCMATAIFIDEYTTEVTNFGSEVLLLCHKGKPPNVESNNHKTKIRVENNSFAIKGLCEFDITANNNICTIGCKTHTWLEWLAIIKTDGLILINYSLPPNNYEPGNYKLQCTDYKRCVKAFKIAFKIARLNGWIDKNGNTK